jgi:hypothetical protein
MEFDYKNKTVKAYWDDMDKIKNSVVTRAVECAQLTIPSVFPKEGFTDENTLDDVYQSFGARAVLNLSSKFMQTLFPPTHTFFKMTPSKELEEQILTRGQEGLDFLNKELIKLETAIVNELERQSLRRPIHEAMKLLTVTGNVLLWKDEEGMTVFNLRDYSVKRDASGNILDIIVREKISPLMLPKDIQVSDSTVDNVDVFTRIVFDGEKYQMYQEVEEQTITGSEKTFDKDEPLPFIVLRWTANANSHYGRGLVEHYIGDLRNYEALNIAVVDTASVMARTLFLVNPNSQYGTDVKSLNEAVTGDYISGHAEDITVPQTNKNSDMANLLQYMQSLELRLSQAFLLFTRRDAERVTAQEIRQVSQALEETLGGVYTLLAEDLQKPLLSLMMKDLNIKLEKEIDTVITTGLDALGRGSDANKLMTFLEMASLVPNAWNYLNQKVITERLAYSNGIPLDGLFKTEEQLQQEAQQAQQMQTEEQFANSLAQQAGQEIPKTLGGQQ